MRRVEHILQVELCAQALDRRSGQLARRGLVQTDGTADTGAVARKLRYADATNAFDNVGLEEAVVRIAACLGNVLADVERGLGTGQALPRAMPMVCRSRAWRDLMCGTR